MSGENSTDLESLKGRVATCMSLLRYRGLTDHNGHVSMRLDDGRILISTNKTVRSRLEPQDVSVIDMEGKQIGGESQPPSETPIHTRVYLANPEIKCVAHIHNEFAIILSIAGIPIRPVSSSGTRFGEEPIPVFQESDLIRTNEQADRLAKILGKRRVCVMRGHGSVLAASCPEEVFNDALSMELNDSRLYYASLAGKPHYLPSEEIARVDKQIGKFNIKSWNYYLAEMNAQGK